MQRLGVAVLIGVVGMAGCAAQDEAANDSMGRPGDEIVLGPADGRDLPAVDLERVQVGDLAPDFTLASLAGPPVTLSSFRGAKDVVLVFYRGHW